MNQNKRDFNRTFIEGDESTRTVQDNDILNRTFIQGERLILNVKQRKEFRKRILFTVATLLLCGGVILSGMLMYFVLVCIDKLNI